MSKVIVHADGLARCPWPKQDPLYVAYHDDEWGVPEYDFRRAFNDFEPEKIARYPKRKIESLMNDAGIVRNRAKIEGAVSSARAWLKIMENGPGFSNFLWDHLDGRPQQNKFTSTKQVPAETPLSKKLSKELVGQGFKFVGPTIVYAFMQAVGMVNDHLMTCHRHTAVSKLARKR